MTDEELQTAVYDYCGPIDLGKCECIQAQGSREQLLANPYCQACGGTGTVTKEILVAALDKLGSDLDQMESTAREICRPAVTLIALAWWHTENAIRKLTGECSMHCKPGRSGRSCGCCSQHEKLAPLARQMERELSRWPS